MDGMEMKMVVDEGGGWLMLGKLFIVATFTCV